MNTLNQKLGTIRINHDGIVVCRDILNFFPRPVARSYLVDAGGGGSSLCGRSGNDVVYPLRRSVSGGKERGRERRGPAVSGHATMWPFRSIAYGRYNVTLR